MRIIELLGVFLARVFRKIAKGDFESAEQDIEQIAKETTGLPLAIMQSNQPEKLIELFSSSFGPDHCRIMAAATILNVSGEIKAGRGDEVSALLDWIKSLRLFLVAAVSPDKEVADQSDDGIKSIEIKLIDYDIPPEMHHKLAVYHEKKGRLSLAEDHWFEAVRSMDDQNQTLAAFYQRTELLSDEKIEAGGLTRSEISESLRELISKLSP